MAKNNQGQEASSAQSSSQPVIAGEETMTIYGVTLAEVISQNARECERLQNDIKERDERLAAQALEISTLTNEKAGLTADKEQMALLILELRPYRTLTTLGDGSIRLPIVLDQDTAMSYLDQAESAGEDAQEYIGKQVATALQAYSSYAGQ